MDAGINGGDYIIVRKQIATRPGNLVVALYAGGLNNLKKSRYDAELGHYYLYSCNTNQGTYAPI